MRIAVVVMLAVVAIACGETDSVRVATTQTPGVAATQAPATDAPTATPAADALTFAVAADVGSDREAMATLEAMGAAEADLHLILGDLSYAGPDSEKDWCELVTEALADAPVQLVVGNHEDDSGEDGHIREFAECLPDKMDSTGDYGTEYFFDVPGLARFILLSPDLTVDGVHYYYGEGNENEQWVRDTIDEAREAGLPWVIVGMHKNCLSVGEYYCNIYQDLLDLLVEHEVDLVLHGHDHTYQRSRQISTGAGCKQVVVDAFDSDCVVDDGEDDSYTKGAGPVFVVNGVGGSKFYDVNPDDPEAGYFVTWMGQNKDTTSGFLRVELTADRLDAEFVNATQASDFEDAFTITTAP